jgi:hypothetical protein
MGTTVGVGGLLAHGRVAAAAPSAAPDAAPDAPPATPPGGYSVLWDDFRGGFSVGSPSAKWFYFAFGPFVGNDGIATTSSAGSLTVRAAGTNPETGRPAFTSTLGQETDSTDNPFGLPGGIDHVKWLVYANHLSSRGVPGFDAVSGQELSFESRFSGESFGTAGHPFGNAVGDAADDLRLGGPAMNGIDFETFMVFDFFLTNKRIYAFYERLPFGRTASDTYAAFSYQIPVGTRTPGASHALKIAYNKAAGIVSWLVDGNEVFRVTRIGRRIDSQYLTLDHGGTERDVSPNQLAGGMGLFTLLDGYRPSNKALVRLSSIAGTYYDVASPGTVAGNKYFADDKSVHGSRLFGQGAELRVQKYVVSSLPVKR